MNHRKSNFELLRILSLYLIIIHHFSVHTQWNFEPGISSTKLLVQSLGIGGKIGVDLFVFITAYFLIEKKPALKSVLTIWRTTLFYSISIFVFLIATGLMPFSIKPLIKSFFPIIFSSYWFVTAYILLFIFSPYINKLLLSLNKKEYQKMLLISFIAFSVIGSTLNTEVFVNNFIWFIFIYSIGGYIKLHFKSDKLFTPKKLTAFLLLSLLLNILSIACLELLGNYISIFNGKENMFAIHTQGFFPLISSIIIFLLFLEIDIGTIKWINLLSSTMFSVYLIHDNTYLRPFIWKFVQIFESNSFINILFISIFSSLVILILSATIDLIRQKLLNILTKKRSDI